MHLLHNNESVSIYNSGKQRAHIVHSQTTFFSSITTVELLIALSCGLHLCGQVQQVNQKVCMYVSLDHKSLKANLVKLITASPCNYPESLLINSPPYKCEIGRRLSADKTEVYKTLWWELLCWQYNSPTAPREAAGSVTTLQRWMALACHSSASEWCKNGQYVPWTDWTGRAGLYIACQ